jgi:hypothetical protein
VAALALCAAPSAAADDADVPRRHDGRPDFSATYDVKTLTPRVRPSHFGERLELTEEEAAAIVTHWTTNLASDDAPSDPNREAPPKGGTGIYAPELTGAGGKVGGYNAFYIDIGESAFKIDGKYRTSILIDPPNGRYPARTERAQKALMARMKTFFHENTGTAWWIEEGLEVGPYDDPELRPATERCTAVSRPPHLPTLYNNLKKIVQTDDIVMINIELQHDTRIIPILAEGPPAERDAEEPTSLIGNSIGWWDGDTLVVDTVGFTPRPGVSEGLHVIERFSPIDADSLLYSFTVDDPAYVRPYSGEYPWPRTDDRIYEYACHEGNYSFGGIMRGARVLEQEALASPE